MSENARRQKGRGPGGRPRKEADLLTEPIPVRVTKDDARKIDAARGEASRSDFVREAVREKIADAVPEGATEAAGT